MANVKVGGIVILAIIIVGILSLRHHINTKGSPAMKTAMKIGDFITWIRFIGFGLVVLFIIFIMLAAKKH